MYGRNIFKLKAVSASIFVVTIILISSAAIPMVNSSKISNLSESDTVIISTHENNGALSASEDFGNYWNIYKSIVKKWKVFNSDTMQDYYDYNNFAAKLLILMNIVLIGSSLTLGPLGGNYLLPFYLMFITSGVDLIYILYTIGVTSDWSRLEYRSCDLVVHVTDQNGKGINGLEGHLAAYSTEAFNEIDNGTVPQNHKQYFTYPLHSDTGYSGPGWYSTVGWWNVNNEGEWNKPPCPPGYWNISITGVEGYQNAYIDQTKDFKKQTTSIIEMKLLPKP